jgi:hypothetical protein
LRLAAGHSRRMPLRMSTVSCGECGRLLAAEGTSPPPEGTPCPGCGSVRRNFTLAVEAGEYIITGESVEAKVVDYPHVLLDEARDLIARRQHGIAVVVAHMACEVAVQRALSAAFVKRNIRDLEDSVSDFFSGYNLSNARLRAFYTALTGDTIQDVPFWQAFKDSAARRNKIVHEGRTATEAEAQASTDAASRFVEHVSRQW